MGAGARHRVSGVMDPQITFACMAFHYILYLTCLRGNKAESSSAVTVVKRPPIYVYLSKHIFH